MFAAPQIFQDSKENTKSALPLKTNSSRKGLKPCSLNNFTQPPDRPKSEKSVSKVDQSCTKISMGEKKNSKPKIMVKEAKASRKDFWTDERELMHDHKLCIESDDDYEDILLPPITKEDVKNLFRDFTSDMYAVELSDSEPPSPIKVSIDFDFPDFSPNLPEYSPPLPELSWTPFEDDNDDDLEFIPLPDPPIILY